MTTVRKVAISVPAETLSALETWAGKMGATRSRVITLAIEQWLRAQELREADRRYVAGYERHPEELRGTASVAAETIAAWAPWDEDGDAEG